MNEAPGLDEDEALADNPLASPLAEPEPVTCTECEQLVAPGYFHVWNGKPYCFGCFYAEAGGD